MVEFLSDFWQGFSGQTSYRPQENYGDFKRNLQGAAFGQAPSAAQAQLQSGKEQAMSAAQSQAAGARGNAGQRAAAQQSAAFGAAAASQQAANQAAALRAQEQAAARQTMADYIGREQQQMSQIELANAAGRQKGYGVIGAVGGGLLGALSDIRAKEQVQPAVALMPTTMEGLDARRRAEDAAREEAARKQSAAGQGGDLLSMAGGMLMSDRRAKELEAENAGLKDRLLSMVVPGSPPEPKQGERRQMLQSPPRYNLEYRGRYDVTDAQPISSDEYRPIQSEADLKQAENEIRRHNAESLRLQALDELKEQRKLDALKAQGAQIQSREKSIPAEAAAELERQRGSVTSDRRAKELERELDAVRDQTLSGLHGVPTRSFPDATQADEMRATRDEILKDLPQLPTAKQSRADLAPLKPYEYRYKPEFAAQQGTDTEPRLGIMAQDALKSPSYQSAVVERPDGMLGLDRDRLLQANTAELAGVDKRLRELEQIKQDALRNIDKARR